MFGLGIVKGLAITLKHFIDTFVDDAKYSFNSTTNQKAFESRQGTSGIGLFTIEYPEKKLPTPERFRYIPFLVTDYEVPLHDPALDPNSPQFNHTKWVEAHRFTQEKWESLPGYTYEKWVELHHCTGCGICSKVCPPQCIWITQASDPKTNKPVSKSKAFYIDLDMCMSCGFCAEFCPFETIRMDHDYELADFEREEGHVHDYFRLTKPISYYATIRPAQAAQDEADRRQKAEDEKRKAEEKARKAAEKATAEAKSATAAPPPTADKPAPAKRTPEEIQAQREAMQAKKATPAPAPEAAPPPAAEAKPAPAKRTPEEIQAQREAMQAKKAAREAGEKK
jgi:NADH-quinone oxidoreductase subunit I